MDYRGAIGSLARSYQSLACQSALSKRPFGGQSPRKSTLNFLQRYPLCNDGPHNLLRRFDGTRIVSSVHLWGEHFHCTLPRPCLRLPSDQKTSQHDERHLSPSLPAKRHTGKAVRQTSEMETGCYPKLYGLRSPMGIHPSG